MHAFNINRIWKKHMKNIWQNIRWIFHNNAFLWYVALNKNKRYSISWDSNQDICNKLFVIFGTENAHTLNELHLQRFVVNTFIRNKPLFPRVHCVFVFVSMFWSVNAALHISLWRLMMSCLFIIDDKQFFNELAIRLSSIDNSFS